MSPRRSAFIDVGTNTVLCLIADIRETGRFRVLDDLADISRLGQGVDRIHRIIPAGEQRALEILQRYRDRCHSLGVEEIIAVGTSALRDAENSAAVRARLRAKLGFDIRVISGAEEAAYSFLAVTRGLALAGRELLVIDIGGGSTEFIRGNDAGVSQVLSIDVGSVRLTERFLHADPVRDDEVAAMLAAIQSELEPVISRVASGNEPLTLVGIAGSFTTAAAIEKQLMKYSHSYVHGSYLSVGEVRRQAQLFREKTIEERKQIAGLEPKRADVILASACLIERIMTLLKAESVVVSDQGVRYGLLHERAQSL
jgi:exopolyphosphatase/guanosine-5'-triphosphate,3'-diphosphate pyrophosphatase